ncbi:hypothetical protein Tco_0189883, partial [Tanacetum coccineum]
MGNKEIDKNQSKNGQSQTREGKSVQEPGISSKGQQSQPWSTIGQPTKDKILKITK